MAILKIINLNSHSLSSHSLRYRGIDRRHKLDSENLPNCTGGIEFRPIPSVMTVDGLDIIGRQDRCVFDDLLIDLIYLLGRRLLNMKCGTLYSPKQLCGRAYWRRLGICDRRSANSLISRLVEKEILQLQECGFATDGQKRYMRI